MQLAVLSTGAAAALPQRRAASSRTQGARRCAAQQPWAAAAAAQQQRRRQWAAPPAAAAGSPEPAAEEPEEGLLPEEDEEIAGTYKDALSTKTPLGKAVAGACDELEALGSLEKQTLEEAEGLLKKLGFKGSLFAAPLPPPADPQQPGASQE